MIVPTLMATYATRRRNHRGMRSSFSTFWEGHLPFVKCEWLQGQSIKLVGIFVAKQQSDEA